MPERYETSITTLENTKDRSKITLAKEVLHVFQAQEQCRHMRQDYVVEGALHAQHNEVGSAANNKSKGKGYRKNYQPCQHCGKMSHPPFKCGRRPNAKCSKRNERGQKVVISKGETQQQEANA